MIKSLQEHEQFMRIWQTFPGLHGDLPTDNKVLERMCAELKHCTKYSEEDKKYLS